MLNILKHVKNREMKVHWTGVRFPSSPVFSMRFSSSSRVLHCKQEAIGASPIIAEKFARGVAASITPCDGVGEGSNPFEQPILAF